MIPNDQFEKFFQGEIQNYVDELNSKRIVLAPLTVASVIIGFFSAVFMFYLIFNTRIMVDSHFVIGMILVLVTTLLLIICPALAYGFVTKNYRKSYKDNVIAKALLNFSDFCEYKHHQGLPETFFESTLLFSHYPSPNVYRSEDLFAIEKDKNAVIFSEVFAMCGSKYSKRTIFQGLLGFIPVGTKFKTPLVIRSRSLDAKAAPGSILTPTYERMADLVGGLKQIKLDDEDFDSTFKVFAAKQKNAKEILNSDIRNGILKLKQEIRSDLHFSFVKGLLYSHSF